MRLVERVDLQLASLVGREDEEGELTQMAKKRSAMKLVWVDRRSSERKSSSEISSKVVIGSDGRMMVDC